MSVSTLLRNVRCTDTNLPLDSFAAWAVPHPEAFGFTDNGAEGRVGWFPNLIATTLVRQALFDRLDGTPIGTIRNAGCLLATVSVPKLSAIPGQRLARRGAYLEETLGRFAISDARRVCCAFSVAIADSI